MPGCESQISQLYVWARESEGISENIDLPFIATQEPVSDIGKCRTCNLPSEGGKLRRPFQPSMTNSRYPISVNARGATCRRMAASRTDYFLHQCRKCDLPPEGGKLHRLFDSSMPKDRHQISMNAGGATCRRRAASCSNFPPIDFR